MKRALSLAVVIACALAGAACTSSPTPTATLEPLADDNVRERIVGSLQSEGKVTRFEVVEVDRGEVALSGWVDLQGRRGRAEQQDGTVLVMADGIRATLVDGAAGDSLRELPEGTALPTMADLPASLDNPALSLLIPLGLSLMAGTDWAAAGEGEWQGQPASIWEANISLGGEGGAHRTLIYLDSDTATPLGERWLAEDGSGGTQPAYEVSYTFALEDASSIPNEAANIEDMRQKLLGYGRYVGTGGPHYELAWLGRETGPIGELPALTLTTTRVTEGPNPWYTEFQYQVFNRVPLPLDARHGLVEMKVWPVASWQFYIEDRDETWLEDGLRETVTVLGRQAKFTVATFNGTRAALWLDDVVITFETVALTDPIPVENYEGGTAPTPVFDRNAFNNAEAIRRLLPLLRPVE